MPEKGFFATTNLLHITEDMYNVSDCCDCSFWLNLVWYTLYRLFVPLTLPTLQILTLDFSTASRTLTKHHVNKIIIDRLEWRNILQFASGCCYKLRRPTIITKCCNPCYKMRSFHLLQNVQLITKCRNPYYKMRKLLQNASLLQNAAEQGIFRSCTFRVVRLITSICLMDINYRVGATLLFFPFKLLEKWR